jgi:hypothetical protein
MTSLPRADPGRDFVIGGQLWNRLADAVERADRLAVAGPLTMIERQGGRVLSLRPSASAVTGVIVEISSQPLVVGGSGGGSGSTSGSITVSGSGKYSGWILGTRQGDVDYSSDISFADLADNTQKQPCLIVNVPEATAVYFGRTPSRWLDGFIEGGIMSGYMPGVVGKPNSDGTPVVYVCFIPFVFASPTGCPTSSGEGSF